jgi:hypothetical protein
MTPSRRVVSQTFVFLRPADNDQRVPGPQQIHQSRKDGSAATATQGLCLENFQTTPQRAAPERDEQP